MLIIQKKEINNMQTSYGSPTALTFSGDIVSDNKRVKGFPALEKIYFGKVVGYPVAYSNLTDIKVQHPSSNKLTFSTTLSASNVINGTLTVKSVDVDGNESIATASILPVTYATSHASTMQDIADAIDTASGGNVVLVISGNSITVKAEENAVVILSGFVVSGGSAVTVSYDFDGTILGIAQRQSMELKQDGTAYIEPTQMVGVMTQGIMTVKSEDAMNYTSSIYTQIIEETGKSRGSIRTSTATGKAVAFSGLKPNGVATAGSLVNVEINNP
jgi:hypothetical protein